MSVQNIYKTPLKKNFVYVTYVIYYCGFRAMSRRFYAIVHINGF